MKAIVSLVYCVCMYTADTKTHYNNIIQNVHVSSVIRGVYYLYTECSIMQSSIYYYKNAPLRVTIMLYLPTSRIDR